MKIKKNHVFSFVFLTTTLIATSYVFSSCSFTSSLQNSTPNSSANPNNKPNGSNSNSKPNDSITNNNSNQTQSEIRSDSLEIENKGDILPSMLLNETHDNIDIAKFIKKYDSTKISEQKFKLISLSDLDGTIVFDMTYKLTNNSVKTFRFEFNNLMKISPTENKISFENINSNLNAYKYSNNNFDFNDFLKQLFVDNNSYAFLDANKNKKIPLNYLDISKFSVENWSNNWFESSNNLSLSYGIENLNLNYYEKSISDNLPVKKTTVINNNSVEKLIVNFSSALDYLINNVQINDKYHEEKTSEYYWGDYTYNNSVEIEKNLINGKWISNFNESLEGTTSKYKIVVVKNLSNANPIIDKKTSNLVFEIRIQLMGQNIYSKSTKEIIISDINKINSDNTKSPFVYNDNESTANKFSFKIKNEIFPQILNEFKNRKGPIRNTIEKNSGKEKIEITNNLNDVNKQKIEHLIKENINIKFNNKDLIQKANEKYFYNDDIYVKGFRYRDISFRYYYNYIKEVFQVSLKTVVSAGLQYYSNEIYLDISNNNALNELIK